MEENKTPVHACRDEPDSRDFQFMEVFGVTTQDIPTKIDLSGAEIQDQSKKNDPSTAYACTIYSVCHAVNNANKLEGSYPQIDAQGPDLRSRQIKAPYRGNVNAGSFIQDALKQAKNEGLIAGYTKVTSLYQMKHALSLKQLLCTGTSKCNRPLTKQTGIFQKADSSYGHAFCIVGYNDETQQFKAQNSYGPETYKEGFFYINYTDIDALFTIYAVADMNDQQAIQAKEDKVALEKSIELGVWNGTNPDQPATRQQTALMIYRSLKLISKITAGSVTI